MAYVWLSHDVVGLVDGADVDDVCRIVFFFNDTATTEIYTE